MAVSRRQAAVVVLGTISLALVACDTLLGLGQYDAVACATHCDSGPEGGGLPMPDASDAAMVIESGADADAAADVVTVPDGGYPPATAAHEIWAHWPMPNPDAAIGPESSTPLPHPMTYTLAADGGGLTAYDAVTKLTWWRQALSATTYDGAWTACSTNMGAGSRVPTRIELVSLIDFTRTPTIETATFLDAGGLPTWTSSAVPGDGGPSAYWDVDFSTGLTGYGNAPTQVLCVIGGTQ